MSMPLAILSCISLLGGDSISESRRALVWNELSAINERSAHALEVQERTVFFEDNGDCTEYANRNIRCTDTGGLRIEGSRWSRGSTDGTLYHHIEHLQVRDGILRNGNVEQGYGVAYTVESERLTPRDEPGALIGLGRYRPRNDLHTRAEFFASVPSIRIIAEDADSVSFEVISQLSARDPRHFRIVTTLNTGHADTRSIKLYDMRWDAVFAQYEMSDWRQHGSVRLPHYTGYRLYHWDIPPEQQAALNTAISEAGLTQAAADPLNDRYQEWVVLRDRVMGGPIPVRPFSRPMGTYTTVAFVNAEQPGGWFDLPNTHRLNHYMSAAIEGITDTFDLEPSDGFVGPASAQEGARTP
ncbi:MAG: hypothetical protein IT434_02250 [Phycisphaerales bacterium]|jgi:hypothetical protein|nr:hypothetical protein [Phycisphaerales bacterium]